MLCPVDGETLQMTERQGVEIDYCPKCRGVWLDRGELDKIIDRSAPDEPAEPARPAPAPAAAPYAPHPGERYAEPRYNEHRSDHRGDPYRKDYRDDDHRYRKPYKKKGFLSDIFDFD